MDLKIIPYIVDGKENPNIPAIDFINAKQAIKYMKEESKSDRLAENYDKWLKLDTMAMYCVVWDNKVNRPVMASGAQHMSNNTCRLFSRYYLFNSYRTKFFKKRIF